MIEPVNLIIKTYSILKKGMVKPECIPLQETKVKKGMGNMSIREKFKTMDLVFLPWEETMNDTANE